jgi:hypothetical protein
LLAATLPPPHIGMGAEKKLSVRPILGKKREDVL